MIGWQGLVWLLTGVAGVGLAIWLLRSRRRPVGAAGAVVDIARARSEFQRRREWLEARFFTLAGASGKPRGLAWSDCEFQDEVVFARDRANGDLRAFVGISIRFEALEGGGMEDNPNVGNVRAATAVFRYGSGQWETDGRAVFNLNPAQTVERFHHEVETAE